jgi:hypothetical protein
MSIVNFLDYKNSKETTLQANVTQCILDNFTENYMFNLVEHRVDLEDPNVAFDIATIQFLMKGMAHRSQGETHPSQIILDKLKKSIVG